MYAPGAKIKLRKLLISLINHYTGQIEVMEQLEQCTILFFVPLKKKIIVILFLAILTQ